MSSETGDFCSLERQQISVNRRKAGRKLYPTRHIGHPYSACRSAVRHGLSFADQPLEILRELINCRIDRRVLYESVNDVR